MIVEEIEVGIGPVHVVQSMLVVEKASQPMGLEMPYIAMTEMTLRAHRNGLVDCEISCPETGRLVAFRATRIGVKMKTLSHLINSYQ